MTVSIANTNLVNSFNTWRLNTNYMATVIGNNVVTVNPGGDANRGGYSKGDGHVDGTFSGTNLKTPTLHGGNTSIDQNLNITSNVVIGTSEVGGLQTARTFDVHANTTFHANVDFDVTGLERVHLPEVAKVRMNGGAAGQFLMANGTASDTMHFRWLKLRDIIDMTSDSAHLTLSGANLSFSDTGDSTKLKFAGSNGDTVEIYLAKDPDATEDSDLFVNLVDNDGDSRFVIADAANNVVAYIDSDGNLDIVGDATLNGDVTLGDADTDRITVKGYFANQSTSGLAQFNGSVDIGSANDDILTVASEIDSNFVPSADNTYSLGKHQKQWKHVFAQNANVASQLTVDGSSALNGLTVTTFTANGNVTLGNEDADLITVVGHFANQSTSGPAVFNDTTTFNSEVDIGNANSDLLTVASEVDSNFVPSANNTYSLGKHHKQWKHFFVENANVASQLYVDGSSALNGLTVTTLTANNDVDFKGGVTLGDASTDDIIVKGNFANLSLKSTGAAVFNGTTTFNGTMNINGDVNLGDAAADTLTITSTATLDNDVNIGSDNTDTVTINAEVDSDIIPVTDNGTGHYNIGSSADRWHNVYANNTYTNSLTVSGDVDIGDASTDTVTINAEVDSHIVPVTDNGTGHYNLGSDSDRWHNVYANNAYNNSLTVSGDVDIGDASTDTVTITAEVDSNIIPVTDDGTGHYNLGSSSDRWHNVYANNASINSLTASGDSDLGTDKSSSEISTISQYDTNGTTTVTATITDQNELPAVGDTVTIRNATPSTLNGSWEVTDVDNSNPYTFEFVAGSNIDTASYNDNLGKIINGTYNETDFYSEVTFHEKVTINTDGITLSGSANLSDVEVTGLASFKDNVDIGGNNNDTLTVTAQVDSDIIPKYAEDANKVPTTQQDFGSSTNPWGTLYANNINLDAGSIPGTYLEDTSVTTDLDGSNGSTNGGTDTTFGSSTKIPVLTIDRKGRIVAASNSDVAGVSSFGYTASTQTFKVGLATGTNLTATIDAATTTSSTGRGVASFSSDNFSISSGHVSIKDNGITLGTETTGNYMSGISGTANEITVSHTPGEGSSATIGLPDSVSITEDLSVGGDLTITGDLTVSGTTTTVSTTNMEVEDALIALQAELDDDTENTNDIGIVFNRGNAANGIFIWDESSDKFWLGTGATGAGRSGYVTGTKAELDATIAWSNLSGVPTYDNYSSWTISDSTNSEGIGSGDTLKFGQYAADEITTVYTAANNTMMITHDDVTRTDNTSDSTASHGGTQTVIDSITTNARGHVTAVNTKTITFPSESDTLDSVCDRGNTTDQIIAPGGLDLADSEEIRLGTGNDVLIDFDGTDFKVVTKNQDVSNTKGIDIDIAGGTGDGTGAGSDITITAGDGGSSGDGGNIEIGAGDAAGSSTDGGYIELVAGSGKNSDNNTVVGSSFNLNQGLSTGVGGSADLIAGPGKGAHKAGGNITVKAGPGTGSGDPGKIIFQASSGYLAQSGGGWIGNILNALQSSEEQSLETKAYIDYNGLTLTDPLATTSGGTGLSSYASGDILYASAENTLSALAKGTDGQVLKLSSGVPTWAADEGNTYDLAATASNSGTEANPVYGEPSITLTGSDSTTDSILISGGTSIDAVFTSASNITINHSDTSTLNGKYPNDTNRNTTHTINRITVDARGHVTDIQTGDLQTTWQDGDGTNQTIKNENYVKFVEGQVGTTDGIDIDWDTTYDYGSGNTPNGSLSRPYRLKISHADTSSQASVNNSGTNFIQDITLDTYGHITGITSASASSALANDYVDKTSNQSISGLKTFTNDYTHFGVSSSGDGRISILTDTGVYGSCEIRFFDNSNDMAWTIGGDDRDNQFKLHWGSGGSPVTIDDLDNPLFEWQETGNFIAQGDIEAKGDLISASDERLKSNIKTIDNALEKVLSLRGVNFDKDGKASTGVIAQEVEKVIPEVVHTPEDEEGFKSVAYGNMVGLLIEAIKDQQKQIEELKQQLGK